MARRGSRPRRAGRVQLRYASQLTFEAYVRARAWEQASLDVCPICPTGECRPERHGTYVRKFPEVARVARFYCPSSGATISMLPDFYASRMPGTLPEIEEVVVRTEEAASIEIAANEIRPGDVAEAVTLPVAIRWVRRRITAAHSALITVRGLLPALSEHCEATVRSFRVELATGNVLVALRRLCEAHLHVLPAPLGLVPPTVHRRRCRRRQQSMGPDPPAERA